VTERKHTRRKFLSGAGALGVGAAVWAGTGQSVPGRCEVRRQAGGGRRDTRRQGQGVRRYQGLVRRRR